MFNIGKKKSSQAPEPNANPATSAPSAAPANRPPKPKGGSVTSLFLPSIAGSALTVLLAGGSLYYQLIENTGKAVTEQMVNTDGRLAVQAIVQQIDVLKQISAVVAHEQPILRALSSDDPAQLQALEEESRQTLAGATTVKIVPLHKGHKDDSSQPPISFAQLEMIKVAEAGSAPPPEVHRSKDQLYVSFVSPIKQGEETVGTLYTAFDFATVKQRISRLPPSIGYMEWQQVFAGSPSMVVAALGDASNKNDTPIKLEWGVPHWSINAYPAQQNNVMDGFELALAINLGLAAILVAGLGLVSMVLTHRKLQANATALAGHFQALVSRDKNTASYSLALFSSVAQTIDRMFLEYDAQLRRQATPKAEAQPSAATSLRSVLEQDDDPLDISLHDDDQDLLGSLAPAARSAPLTASVATEDALDLDDIEISERSIGLPPEGLSAEIFRAYDIRGIVGTNLTPAVARLIGAAVGSQALDFGQRAVIVARDGRLSSESLLQALIEGLLESGQRVIDIGMVPTPVLYFATHTLDTQTGVMVTGSHNPPDYNGFKIVIDGTTLSNQAIQSIRVRIESGRLARGQGTYMRQDILRDYRDRITHDVVLAKPMRIIVDCGNGVSSVTAPEVLDRLGCSVTTLFGEVDGRFPNHHPDPSIPENLQALIEAVRNNNADLGIAFDGDGDRIGVVTRQGTILWPDRLLMLYARDLLSRNPGADVVYDVKCTRDIVDLVSSLGGRAILSPTGHSLMKAKMKETGALVGGELSGHIFFNDRWYGFDDATYAAARLLEILSMEPYDIDEVFAEFPARVNTQEIKIPLSEARKFAVVEKLAEQGNFSGGNLVKIDGVRVDYPDGWGLIRASNTTPNLIARFEGDDDAALQRVMQRFHEQLHNVEPGLSIPF